MKIIGLDVGEKRIGVAKVDSSTRIAVPVGYIEVNGSEWQEIARIARINGATYFVIGLPRSNEGNETKQSAYARQFGKTLVEKVPGARVRFQDESLTSVMAEDRLKGSSRTKKKAAKKGGKGYERGDIDAEAATIILQDFIETFKEPEAKPAEKTSKVKKSSDKVKMKTKKLTKFLIISPIVLVLLIAGVVGVVVWRQNELKRREEMWAELESQMKPDVFSFMIRPGETIFDVKENLAKIGYSEAEIEDGFNYDYSNEEGLEFLKARPSVATLEGFLYGETHEFYGDATVKDILTVFLQGMGDVIRENQLVDRYAAHGLSLFEGITLASIVQKEAKPSDQAEVARVFLNRLDNGMTLGSDVTVSYALDVLDPNREIYVDNQSALEVDSCYNTRNSAGLPCGPISNPSLSALLAVAEPADNTYLFFLTGDDGVMYYSNTGEEHAEKAQLYCQELCNVSL